MEEVRIGIIGAGRIAQIMSAAYSQIRECRLLAVNDVGDVGEAAAGHLEVGGVVEAVVVVEGIDDVSLFSFFREDRAGDRR